MLSLGALCLALVAAVPGAEGPHAVETPPPVGAPKETWREDFSKPPRAEEEAELERFERTLQLQKALLLTGAALFAAGNIMGWTGYYLWLEDLRTQAHQRGGPTLQNLHESHLTERGGAIMVSGIVLGVAGVVLAAVGYGLDATPAPLGAKAPGARSQLILSPTGGTWSIAF